MTFREQQIIQKIENIRSKNNRLWMHILRLALQYVPEQTKAILNKITECDSEINKLSKQLAEGDNK